MLKKLFNNFFKLLVILLIVFGLVACKDKDEDDGKNDQPSLPNLAEKFISETNKITTVSLDSKEQIDLCIILYGTLEEAYSGILTDQRIVDVKTKLDGFIISYNSLKEEELNKQKSEILINEFILAVSALPATDLLAIEDLEYILLAENNYNLLSDSDKTKQEVVVGKSTLDAVRVEYNKIMDMDADEYNAHKYVIGVAGLPEVEELSLDDLVTIDELEKLYSSLTSSNLNTEKVLSAKEALDSYSAKYTELKTSQEKASAFIMAVFSLPTGSALKYQNAEQKAEIERAYATYESLTDFEKSISGVNEAYEELNIVKTQFEGLKEPYDISKVSPTHLCLYYYGAKKLSFNSGKDPRSILINNYGLTAETIKDNVKIYLDVYIEAGAIKGSPLFSIDITEDYNVTTDDIVEQLKELKAAGNDAIKTGGYTFTIHIESLNETYASSEYSNFFSATQIPIE